MFFFEYSPSRHKPASAQKGTAQKTCPICLSVYTLYRQLTDLPLLFFLSSHLHWCRVEFDAYRSDLEYYKEAPRTEINQLKIAETQVLLIICGLLQCCGTVTICCDSGSDFRKVWFRFRLRIQTIFSTIFQQQQNCTKSCLIKVRSSIISQKAESWPLSFDF